MAARSSLRAELMGQLSAGCSVGRRSQLVGRRFEACFSPRRDVCRSGDLW